MRDGAWQDRDASFGGLVASTWAAGLFAFAAAACGTEPAKDGGGGTCAGAEVPGAPGCADEARYLEDLKAIALPRSPGSPHHAVVRARIEARLAALGYDVQVATYGSGTNVYGVKIGSKAPDEVVVVGGHYDGVYGCPAADDNATAVAGALEVARLLASQKPERTLVFAFWDEEERGLVGSRRQVIGLLEAGKKVAAVFDFEMIGYATDLADSQQIPPGFDFIFPEVGAYISTFGKVGNFITLVHDAASQPAVELLRKAMAAQGLPAVNVGLEDEMLAASSLSDLRRSDHASFWAAGYPGIMLTDTANFRNTHYHCGAGQDTVERLDHRFAIRVVQATAFAAQALLASASAPAKAPRVVACDLAKAAEGAASGCGAGKKCSHHFAVFTQISCVDVGGVKKLGEACTRPTNVLGVDDCEAGLFCTPWGEAGGDPAPKRCARVCASDAGCGGGEFCALLGTRAFSGAADWPIGGLCMARCDPFAPGACKAGTQCTRHLISADDKKAVYTCLAAGDDAEGVACNPNTFGQCANGLVCAYGSQGEAPACRAPCDGEHACGAGRGCQPDGATSGAGMGICLP